MASVRRFVGRIRGTVLVLAVGCGGGDAGVAVKGTVTVDGRPADGGAVTFVSAASGVVAGGGVIQNGGGFTARCPAGSYKVRVSVPRPTGAVVASMGNAPVMEEGVAEEFNDKSTLTAEVKPGGADLTFAVTGRPAAATVSPPAPPK